MNLLFDLWLDDCWAGMAVGVSVQDARARVARCYTRHSEVLMTPHYGRGTSHATFEAITGRKAKDAP